MKDSSMCTGREDIIRQDSFQEKKKPTMHHYSPHTFVKQVRCDIIHVYIHIHIEN